MRKMKIGIFALATVILFLLSTSVSVTAYTHQETLMELTSMVQDDDPKASVDMDPQDVWDYEDWVWELDIDNGDNVYIDTECIWINANYFQEDSGYHYYYAAGVYRKGGTTIPDSDSTFEWTDGTYGAIPEQGSRTIHLQFDNLEQGGLITLYWYVYAENKKYSNPVPIVDEEHSGLVRLT